MKKILKLLWLILFIATPLHLAAQLISIKTVPLASGEQFHIFPSQNLGMGNVTIAVDDTLLDPFINPAKGGLNSQTEIVFAPVFYKITSYERANKTLPLSILLNKTNWFTAASLSIQELNLSKSDRFPAPMEYEKLKNSYFFASYGRRLGQDQTFLAASVYWADLSGIDGVEHLYSQFSNLTQSGDIIDLRLGFYTQLKKDVSLEALLIHNRFDMKHEFIYDLWWDNITYHTEYDRTNTWALHLDYIIPFDPPPWKIGFIFTANLLSHPKIPNYELMRIPRDPGNSWAYNAGFGISNITEKMTFGLDCIYEPILSHTWADAETAVETSSGHIIKQGDKTVNNDFFFSNAIFRVGITPEISHWGFQLGLEMHAISYKMTQHNYIEGIKRKLQENWIEWSLNWGLFFKFQDFQLRYAGRVIKGTGRPGVDGTGIINRGPWVIEDGIRASYMDSNFIIAPSGSLILEEASIITHQITLSVPLR